MLKIADRLYVGSLDDHRVGDEGWAVVHACKSPCHQHAVGYRGNLPNSHPHYLVLEQERDLYLNIIDPDAPLFMLPTFTSFLDFSGRHWDAGRNLLIHCNQGESRAPSLALVFLAKHTKTISTMSYIAAKEDFQSLYPQYRPGRGIQVYLTRHWDDM